MTPEKWQQVKSLVEQALEQDVDKRLAFLSQACGEDKELYTEAEALILADSEMSGFLEKGANEFLEKISTLKTNKSSAKITEKGLTVGTTFLGKYEIVRLIGKGGMGLVYQARHVELDTQFAIKILNTNFVEDSEAIERFKREARTAAKLEHPNIVKVFDYGVEDTVCYLVMEYLVGESLRTRLKTSKKLEFSQVVDFAREISIVLDFVHSKGIIHRDLKPDNIFFHKDEKSETLKLLDFGIAKLSNITRSGESLTLTGSIFGTPQYMSPEQCEGKALDARSDIYSLGIILYEMFSGRRPFEADNALSFMYAQVHTPPLELAEIVSDLPHPISQLVMQMLVKDKEKRIKSAKELVEKFSNIDLLEDYSQSQTLRMGTTTSKVDTNEATLLQLKGETNQNKAIYKPKSKTVYMYIVIIAVVLPAFAFVVARFPFTQANNLINNKTVETPKINKPIEAVKKKLLPLPDSLRENFVLIEAGEFTIGRDLADCNGIPNCEISLDETPAHKVTLKSYYISKYEVTNKEYYEFVKKTKYQSPKNWQKGKYLAKEEDYPVTYVSWEDAKEYCLWLTERDGIKYRLPSEAEWEHAARGNDNRLFPWGNSWDETLAHGDRKKVNSPVAINAFINTRDSSPYNVFAMAGNVREWTNSDFAPYPNSKREAKEDDLKCKVIRGGSFDVEPNGLRNSFRAWLLPNTIVEDIGFRLAIDAEQ